VIFYWWPRRDCLYFRQSCPTCVSRRGQHPSAGNGYYLFDKFQALDAPGEFYHDPTTGQLYVWTPNGDNPANHLIEVKHRDYAFDVSGKSDIHLDGINFVAATIRSDSRSARLVMNHLHASYTSAIDASVASNADADWSGSTFANNIFFNAVQFGQGVRLTDNLFANTNPRVMARAAANYCLTPGSPAINRGAMLGSYTSDYD
jgi:hypothetical protein